MMYFNFTKLISSHKSIMCTVGLIHVWKIFRDEMDPSLNKDCQFRFLFITVTLMTNDWSCMGLAFLLHVLPCFPFIITTVLDYVLQSFCNVSYLIELFLRRSKWMGRELAPPAGRRNKTPGLQCHYSLVLWRRSRRVLELREHRVSNFRNKLLFLFSLLW